MAQIRDAFKLKLINILEELTGFYGADFSFITEQHKDSSLLFLCKNKINEDIYFQFILDTELQTFKDKEKDFLGEYNTVKSYAFDTVMSPGEFFQLDNTKCNGEEVLYTSFEKWAVRAWDEFKASSIIQRLEIEEEKINELNKEMGKIGEEYFTIEEAEKLKFKLENLEKTLQEHIRSSEIEENKKTDELKKIRTDIEFLTNNLTVINKKNWFNGFFTRFSPMKLDEKKRKILLQFGGKGLGLLIQSKTGDSTVKEFIEEITK